MNAIEAVSGLQEAARRVSVATRPAEDGAVEIVVADSGPGVPPEFAERIFEPFFTTKPRGLGMGLSVSRTIAESLGGRLQLDASPAGGSCFRLKLPATSNVGPVAVGCSTRSAM